MKNNELINEINGKRDIKVNTPERIAIMDLSDGIPGHWIYVYFKPDEKNIIRLWCSKDKTFRCVHTKFAWSIPDVQEKVQITSDKAKLARLE